MSRFTDDIYRHWLRQNSQGTPRRAAAGDARGMGPRPMSSLPRPTYPTAQGAASPGRLSPSGAQPPHSPALAGLEPAHGDPPRGAAAANDGTYSRHEKQNSAAVDYVDNLFLKQNEDYYPGGSR
ncbi:hypothetical protein CLU85_2353 [Acidovorax sp. 69]|nr:hypothetical protein CLU85_2353 [Acidovorax sp. 69]